jgi:hypothetical protein
VRGFSHPRWSNFETKIADVREKAEEFRVGLEAAGTTVASQDGTIRVGVAPNGPVLGRTRETADLILVDEDFLTARDLGLSEVDYRVWRQTVPAAELTDVRVDAEPAPVEGSYRG